MKNNLYVSKNMNHTTLAVVAIVAAAALLITATSLGATQAFAHHGKYSKTSQRSGAEIAQVNKQSSFCDQPATVNIVPISCNEIGVNANVAPSTAASVITH